MQFFNVLSLLLLIVDSVFAAHFNGGSITWAPVNPISQANATSVTITITQHYSWGYPLITCATNVPISTPGRSSQTGKLSCVVDCSTDGGYSNKSIDILTDCLSANSVLGMMTSERSVNVTLQAGAHFSVAYQGSAWRPLNSPSVSGSAWSILCSIDLRLRPDGLINTPPVSSVASPQYVVPNTTVQIQIPVSDVNPTDDVRCRWSKYIQGYRRRRQIQFDEEQQTENFLHRHYIERRGTKDCTDPACQSVCSKDCKCSCSICVSSNCATGSNWKCATNPSCPQVSTTTRTTRTTTSATTTLSPATTTETLGTFPSTSSFPSRQAVDECAGICFPKGTPNTTILSSCTLSFTGLIPNTWYAVAVQVEDFFSVNSTTAMSSVPVQFLIYVLPIPACPTGPTVVPQIDCSEAQIGVPTTLELSITNNCDPSDSTIAGLTVTSSTTMQGLRQGNLTQAADQMSATVIFTWTPTASQNGSQLLCVNAFTR